MITVSIVSGRQEKNLSRCLKTLQTAIAGLQWELIAIDNCSNWNVVQTLAEQFVPSATIIHNSKPLGFGANHNQALLNRQDDYALILNDDIEIDPNAIRLLVEFADKTPQGVIFGPILYPRSWNNSFMPAGGAVRSLFPKPVYGAIALIARFILGNDFVYGLLGKRERKAKAVNEKRGYISGACCLVRRSFIQKYGLYDDGFYMYYEDIDLGTRARQAGFECWQVGAARVMHLGGASFNEKTWLWFADSSLYFARKHCSLLTQAVTFFLIGIFRILYFCTEKIVGHRLSKR